MKCDDDTFVNVPNLVHFLLGGTVPVYDATFRQHNRHTMKTLMPKNRLSNYENLLVGIRFTHSKPISDYTSKWYANNLWQFLIQKVFNWSIFVCMQNLQVYTSLYVWSRNVSELFVWFWIRFHNGYGWETLQCINGNSIIALGRRVSNWYVHLKCTHCTLLCQIANQNLSLLQLGICAEKAGITPINYQLFNYLPFKDMCEFRGMITLHEIKLRDMKKAYDFVMNPNVTCEVPFKRSTHRPLRNGWE